MEIRADSLESFNTAAASFIKELRPKASGATLVTLSGELGAGKTAFTKAAAKALGVVGELTSPTFVLEKVYQLPECDIEKSFTKLIHIDAYRLEGGKELGPLRFDELLQEADNLIMLEWPEKVADALPLADVRITIETLSEGARKITYA